MVLQCAGEPREVGGDQVTPPPLVEKPPGPETEKFQMVYHLNAIRVFGFLSWLKVALTAMTVLALPPVSTGTPRTLCLASGAAGFAWYMLCWMSYFFRMLVGILYVNESGTVLQVVHPSFWGWWQDTYCPVEEAMLLTEMKDNPQDRMCVQQYSGKQTFYRTLRYGHVVDRERFAEVPGAVHMYK